MAAITGNAGYASKVVNENVVDALTTNADSLGPQRAAEQPIDTTKLIQKLDQPAEAEQVIPGFKATTADRSGDFGIASLEDARSRGQNAGRFKAGRDANAEAVEDAMQQVAPTERPGVFSEALDAERGARVDTARGATQDAQAKFEQATQALQPAMTGEARGADIRAALEGASAEAKGIVRQAWEPLNSSGAQMDVVPLADEFGRVNEGLSVAERRRFRPSEADIPDQLAGRNADEPPDAMLQPIREVTGLRSALTDAAREARTAGRANEARIIDQHIEALDGAMDNAVPADLREQYDTARAATRDYADRFQRPQTAIAQTLDRQQGKYRQPDSAVARKFVQDDDGRIADFQALIREAGPDARTRGAVRDQVLADVRDRGLVEKPDQLDDYLGRYRTVFDEFPGLRAEVGTAGALRRELGAAQGAEKSIIRELGDGQMPGRGVVAKYLKQGEENARKAMSGVMSAGKPAEAADELLTFVGDEAGAVQGARRAFWDVMENKGRSRDVSAVTKGAGVEPWIPQTWRRWLNEPNVKAVAERLYKDDPEQLERVNEIADALKSVNLGKKAGTAINPSGTAQAQRGNFTMAELQAKSADVARGRLSKMYFVTYFAGRIANRAVSKQAEQAYGKLLDKALLDPEIAKKLLTDYNPANRAAMARSAKAWLGNQASGLIELLDPEDETTSAIMGGD
ncbi:MULTISPECIES: hypothetical protein [unclassified Aurantimonas]|uniref:hypothetical protein n=1 Tax=unclassified Aurantimonas TaxID=2638230 RepID=UPI002E18E861|nr:MULTISPECIES: hypothetical protein [unclassified Aurantimonas]MEC5291597.1 hypothetical protein [Aurantimonas sp. C2-3-R2]MEC5412681.1 hypothetical protein [Aurantimonas sp. C2-4-R8]